MKLLIVDDVKFSAEIGKSFLEDKGCEILSASNGEEALEVIKNSKPDLILTDLHMPKMNGDELCKTIKSDPALSNLPVVILSSDSNAANLEKCRRSGCDGILKKPFRQDEIIETVRQYINIISRKHKRAVVDLDVFYNFEGETCSAKVIDISKGGMFVKNDVQLPLGAETDFFIVVDGEEEGLKARGEIIRIVPVTSSNAYDQKAGMGIKFKDVSPELAKIIDGSVN